MSEQADQHQRTEEPTPKRLEDALKKGDAPKSQEIVATAALAGAVLALWLFARPAALSIASTGAAFLDHPEQFSVDGGSLQRLFAAVSVKVAIALGAVMALFVLISFLAHFGQARPVFSIEKLKPSLERISPIAGFKRVFGPTALVNFFKGIGKLAIVGSILTLAIWPDHQRLAGLAFAADEKVTLGLMRGTLIKLFAAAAASMIVISALDYAWARREWKKRLRMTKEEVRREMKEQEGDPQIKSRQRQQREARARRRMMSAVKDATVLIMNPTHFAVALKYEASQAPAPVCVAKGLDELALRLRAAAAEAGVPVVENPPLARALYAAVEIEEEIPVEHYEAVAKVIGFVMGRAKKGAGEGSETILN